MSHFYTLFFNDFQKELNDVLGEKDSIINQTKKVINFIEEKIEVSNNWLRTYEFQCTEEEIYFFKCLKPKLISKLIYYKAILNIESEAPFGKTQTRKHYEKALNKIYQYSKKNRDFYSYYRSGSTHRDEEYFVRSKHKPKLEDDCFALLYDTSLCTEKYYEVGKIIANDMLSEYYEIKNEEIDTNCKLHHAAVKPTLNWTGSKIDLVELVYALHQQKVFNGGNTDLKEIAAYMGKMFNIELEENIYRSYLDIKNRKTGHTKFLISLSESLNSKILSEDL